MGNSFSNGSASCQGLWYLCSSWAAPPVCPGTPGSPQQQLPPVPPYRCLPRASLGALQLISGTAPPGFLISLASTSGPLVSGQHHLYRISSSLGPLSKDSSQRKKNTQFMNDYKVTPGKQAHIRNSGCHTQLPPQGPGLLTLLSSGCVLMSLKLSLQELQGKTFCSFWKKYPNLQLQALAKLQIVLHKLS